MAGWELGPFALSALLTACCALFVQRRRAQPGAQSYTALLVGETFYSVGYAGELAARTLEGKVFWDNMQLLAYAACMPFMLLFAWDYAERGPRRRGPFLGLYMVVPALTVAWVLSDPLHGLARASARVDAAPPFGTLLYDFTLLDWLAVLQGIATVAYASVVLTRTALQQHHTHRLQVFLIVFGIASPTLASLLGMAGYRLLGQRDMAPMFFGLSAVPITWALSRGRFFDLAPVARHVVFAQLPDPVLVLDASDRVIDLNPCAQALLGALAVPQAPGPARLHKPVGKRLTELLPNAASQTLRDMQTGTTVELALGERIFDARSDLLETRRGTARGRVVLLRDISERKAAEQGLQRAHEALEQRVATRTRELQVANAALEVKIAERETAERAAREAERQRAALSEELHHAQKLDSIGRLAGGIAHDFNNLLTVILGQIELGMMSYRRGKDPADSLEQATFAANSAAKLTHQLLAFARRQPASPRVLDVNATVETTHRMLSRLIGEDVKIQLRLARSLKRVRIDPGQLEQVVLNVSVNARDAMPGGGLLSISTEDVVLEPAQLAAKQLPEAPQEFVRVRITDTGLGMPPEIVSRIFEPFFTTKAPGAGTGIGLATVYGVVKQVGGFVEVKSAVGEGTTFDIYFPATESSPEPARVASSEVPKGEERVALVEDQAALRELVSDQLHRLGYQVVTFPKAEDALVASEIATIDLLITDVVLTGMSGPALVDHLRQARSDLKVLYVSGYSDDEVFARGLDAESAPLLYKPFSIRELAQAVRGVLQGPS